MPSLPFKTSYTRQIALWVVRAFSPALCRDRFFKRNDYADSDIPRFLHFPELDNGNLQKTSALLLDTMQSALETTTLPVGLDAQAVDGFTRTARLFGLNATEQTILQYAACTLLDSALQDTHRLTEYLMVSEPARFYAKVLALPRRAVHQALEPTAKLQTCGLLDDSHNSKRFVFASTAVARHLLFQPFDSDRILSQYGTNPPPPVLGIADYPQIQTSLDLILPYLKKAVSRRKRGVNLLLYGPPGTGKTQLARVIAQAVGMPAFELAVQEPDGTPILGKSRLNTLGTAETIFNNRRALFIFDEAEDVLAANSALERSAVQTMKGWFNQKLENNKCPTLWIANAIDGLDPAYARRFDFILEVPIPSRPQREKMLHGMVGKILSPGLIGQLAQSEYLSPAVVARTHHVIQGIGKSLPASRRDAAFSRLITSTLKAQGHPDPCRQGDSLLSPGIYDPAYLNTEADLYGIARRLKENPSARLCLYGPPGTGKTSFGHWLAAEIEQPLHVKKASDLINSSLGETEKKIARTFHQARQEGAVLLLDEVDSFLQDRSRAVRTWEISQVNEMLTQIESFSGVMMAATNLMMNLDPASLRRFDLKLEFGYLLPEQTARLLTAHCKKLALSPPAPADLAAARTLRTVTPGDFAAVARQHRFQPVENAAGFLQALFREQEYKTGPLRLIGF